jgi:hypothetical protein
MKNQQKKWGTKKRETGLEKKAGMNHAGPIFS